MIKSFANRVLVVVAALSLSAGTLAARCTDSITRVADGTQFQLQGTRTIMEGGFSFAIKDFGFTFGEEAVEYGVYKSSDGSTVLVECDDIAPAS